MTRTFWPVSEAAQADYEQLRALALAGVPALGPAARRFESYGLWGLITSPRAAPAFVASIVGAERPAWSPYQDPRDQALADGFQIIVAAQAVTRAQEQTG